MAFKVNLIRINSFKALQSQKIVTNCELWSYKLSYTYISNKEIKDILTDVKIFVQTFKTNKYESELTEPI